MITDTTGITQRDMPTGTALDVVVVEAATLKGVERTEITEEPRICEGDLVKIPPPHQDGQRQQGGGNNCPDGDRSE